MRKLDFSHVKVSNPAYFEVFVDDLWETLSSALARCWCHTVGVFLCVLDRTISRKSLAVGTGAIALRPLVDMLAFDNGSWSSVYCVFASYRRSCIFFWVLSRESPLSSRGNKRELSSSILSVLY